MRAMVPIEEIADPKNDFNLNLPRYIDSSEPEDIQDIDGHLRGGIPERDLDALGELLAGHARAARRALRAAAPRLFQLKTPIAEVKPAILGHPEFVAFNEGATKLFEAWKAANTPLLKGPSRRTAHPKALIETLSESLLADFKAVPLLDAYDVYQHLMDYWAETMQDDAYLIAAVGWKEGASPREIRQVKNKDGKLVWPEKEDFRRGKRRFKSDLVPVSLVVDRFFRERSKGAIRSRRLAFAASGSAMILRR